MVYMQLYWGMDNWEKAVHHYTEGWKLNPSDELWLHIATLLPKASGGARGVGVGGSFFYHAEVAG
jgi:hypothetical protein